MISKLDELAMSIRAHVALQKRVEATKNREWHREALPMKAPKYPAAVAQAIKALLKLKGIGNFDADVEKFRRVMVESNVIDKDDRMYVVETLDDDEEEGVTIILEDGRQIEFVIIPAGNGRSLLFGSTTKEKA